MKVCTIAFGVLLACVACLAVENGPLLHALEPQYEPEVREVVVLDPQTRQKRSLLLGAGALGLGALGLGAAGLGAAGLVGAGLVGAKAGLIGGAIIGKSIGRSYGGYGGYGGGYYRPSYSYGYGGYGHGYGGYGGYRTAYIVEDPWC